MAAETLNVAAPATVQQVQAALGTPPDNVEWEVEASDIADGYTVAVAVFATTPDLPDAVNGTAATLRDELGVEVITDRDLLARQSASHAA